MTGVVKWDRKDLPLESIERDSRKDVLPLPFKPQITFTEGEKVKSSGSRFLTLLTNKRL
ncbi:hypothetical protein MAH4_23150 [Sessilibacter sp. MAH4]